MWSSTRNTIQLQTQLFRTAFVSLTTRQNLSKLWKKHSGISFIGFSGDGYRFSDKESSSFLTDVLQINKPHKLLKQDKFRFLSKLSEKMIQRIPWQVVDEYIVEGTEEITFQMIKENFFQQKGGGCAYINLFLKPLLDSVGIESYFVQCCELGIWGFHTILAVKDLTYQGSIHLIDVGNAVPIHDLIPLDFEEESPVYQHGYYRHKYKRRKDGMISWMCDKTSLNIEYQDIQCKNTTEVEMLKMKPNFKECGILDTYTVSTAEEYITQALKVLPLILSKLKLRVRMFSDGNYIFLWDKKILTASPDGSKIYIREVESMEEMHGIYERYLPQLDKEAVKKMITSSYC